MRRLFLIAVAGLVVSACSGGGGTDLGAPPTTTSVLGASPSTSSSVPALPRASCPAELSRVVASSGTRSAGREPVLVAIPATSVRVCRYPPLNAKPPNALVRFGVITDAAAVRRLEASTNALHRISHAEAIPCPLVPSTPGWSIVFRGSGSTVTLVVSAADCGFVTNGDVTAAPTKSWLDSLARVATLH